MLSAAAISGCGWHTGGGGGIGTTHTLEMRGWLFYRFLNGGRYSRDPQMSTRRKTGRRWGTRNNQCIWGENQPLYNNTPTLGISRPYLAFPRCVLLTVVVWAWGVMADTGAHVNESSCRHSITAAATAAVKLCPRVSTVLSCSPLSAVQSQMPRSGTTEDNSPAEGRWIHRRCRFP